MDRTELAATHPALLEAILAEGRTTGASAERARILAIEAAAIPGHDALVATLKADGSTSAGDAALQILAAEKAVRIAAGASAAAEAPKPLALVPPATVAAEPAAADSREALDAKALAYQAAHPGTSYIDAVKAVQAGAK